MEALPGRLDGIKLGEPAYARYAVPAEAAGVTEAPRGALGRWLKIQDGRIAHYQVITPPVFCRHSLHELGLLGVLEFLDRAHRPDGHILGVQPSRIGPGLDLAPQVAAVLPRVGAVAREIVRGFGDIGA